MAAGLETEAPKRRTSTASERAFLGTSALLFLVCAAGTVYYSLTVMPNGMAMPGQSPLGSAAAFMGIWMLMMVAMMQPSLVPALAGFRRMVNNQDEAGLGGLTMLAGAGYFCVWAGFGVVAYLLGLMWTSAGMIWMDLARLAPFLIGFVMLLAGGLQLTPWKAHQLDCCRDTQTLAVSTSPEAGRAWQYGLRLGLHCCLCCSGFMATLLVTGMMNLAGMAVIAAAITLERLVPRPRLVARTAGIIIILAGAFVIARGLALV
jgi:predicted metal-binding membrane protein